ncbi:TonB-dependent receptor [Tardiphaga alba]|uniref:TonB-dependent receptor n=1 Tax=Tardiphaga alba TaxID=340268 RepID=A0ABX8A9J3_9BRAD|nr:TonB-dependent receptor [Tardiphaga alba]QUS39671.1 TonB-dependent receptor [Tardiphaga alba]
MRIIYKTMLLSSVASAAISCAALAQDRQGVYQLGEIVVTGARNSSETGISESVVTREDVWNFDKKSLDQAVSLIPGVSANLDANGRRNESDIYVRGFNRQQVPLTIDGVRVYLPADNRLDFSRFMMSDISEVQIQKGYSSVLSGPGGMGGAINLVTRKPAKPFEAEFQSGLSFGGKGEFQGWNSYASAGTRQEGYYVQGSASYLNRDFWTMSDNYNPTPGSLEDGGKRGSSDSRDWSINAKVGITPNATDEYSINFIKQSGEKGAPLNVNNNPPVPANNYWRWPLWDLQNIAFLSNTALGDASYVKTKFFYNTFNNGVDAFDNINYTTQSQNGRFISRYADKAYGGSTEIGTDLIPMNSLKAALHYRADQHSEYNHNRPTSAQFQSLEPTQYQEQTTWSVAAENTFHATRNIDLVGGVSYDKYWISKAEDFNSTTAQLFEYPKGGSTAFNWQSAAIWRYSDTGQLNVSVSDRARFPTIFELYSTRFGTATPNPNLGPERATNYEIGWKDYLTSDIRASGAIFYSDVTDMIQTVQIGPGITQTQNVGNGNFYGYEVSLDAQVNAQLKVGGNYTYLYRTITDPGQPNLQPTGVPTHKAFLYLAWKPTDRLTITPSLEIASARWSDVSTNPVQAFPYVMTGAYTMANVQMDYKVAQNFDIGAGVRNLLDQNYELSWGLPQPGRNYYLKARMTF